LEGGAPIPDLDALAEAERTQPPTYVPNRNMMLLSMAAAYAEAGRFDDAVRTAEKARAIARAKGLREFAGKMEARIEQFKKRRPVRSKE
ncbi:hypothetical protein LCGC14_2319450, partial [marine sediment metagenome]